MNVIKIITDRIEKNRPLQHILFWFIYSIANVSIGLTSQGDTIAESLIFNFLMLIPQILAAYYFTYFIILELFFKHKYFSAVFFFILGTYFFSALARVLVVHVGEPLIKKAPFEQETILEILTDIGKLWEQYIPLVYSVSFIFLFVKFFLEYKHKKEEQTQLSKEKIEVELKTLKAQLNPHFLFNTLNNIYSLSLDSSPKTPVAIAKLSDILDHILYKCDSQLVSLSTEIQLLQNYIELEKLRYDERLKIQLETTIENDTQIPPLLLLSLVENAFKHGAGEDSGSPKISILIVAKKGNFTFEILNSVSNDYENKGKENIGLTNIRKQLDLIYGNDYEITIYTESNLFKVILKIKSQ
jgi:sensor histidine kinase YesM